MSDDGFIEVHPESAKASKAACSIACTEMGRQKARRVTVSFRLDDIHQEVATILVAAANTGMKFMVAFNPDTMAIRIQAHPSGQFETVDAPRTEGRVVILRFPLPKGMVFSKDRVAVDPDSNLGHRAILIDLPEEFRPKPSATRPMDELPVQLRTPAPIDIPRTPFRVPRDVAPALMGDPPAGRSALDARKR